MSFQVPHTVAHLAYQVGALRKLRKVKVFIKPQAVTIVTYYKQTQFGEQSQYQGYAHIYRYNAWKGTTVALAHTSHLPPPTDESETSKEAEAEEVEQDPAPLIPGFGFSLIH